MAATSKYVRPEIDAEPRLDIRLGRHPVVEQLLQGNRYVPNDATFEGGEIVRIITGPNMSGKSTYLRQVALIVLMAQMGSFVPAESARIGLVDRIFTRIGAQDEIHAGQSTFMVEMVETANILHHATTRSLLILDEIGRGTSTYDGLSIAWAVVEFIHNHPQLRARTLFATHYHELIELADTAAGRAQLQRRRDRGGRQRRIPAQDRSRRRRPLLRHPRRAAGRSARTGGAARQRHPSGTGEILRQGCATQSTQRAAGRPVPGDQSAAG